MNLRTPLSRRDLLPLLAAATAIPASAAQPEQLKMPSGEVILTISGAITNLNAPGTALFDVTMLEQIGVERITTTTPWLEGLITFEGVRMSKLLTIVGAKGNNVIAYAANDYTSEIPISDYSTYPAIIALKRNGEYLPADGQGPLWIIYPYNTSPVLQQQKFYSRSVWQLQRLEIT